MLNHDYIGTEHILLGLIHEGEGVAARALAAMGISVDSARQRLEEIIGQDKLRPSATSPSRHGRRRCSRRRSAKPCSSDTTTSAPSTSCSGCSAKARAGGPGPAGARSNSRAGSQHRDAAPFRLHGLGPGRGHVRYDDRVLFRSPSGGEADAGPQVPPVLRHARRDSLRQGTRSRGWRRATEGEDCILRPLRLRRRLVRLTRLAPR